MKFIIFAILLFTIPASWSQTYEVLEVDLEAEAKTVEGLNTKWSDFSPFVFEDKLYFTSLREYDLYNLGENNWKNNGFLNLFVAEIKGDISEKSKIKTASLFSDKLISNSHTGPMCLSVTGDTLFYTQVVVNPKKNKKDKAKPQLYMAIKEGKEFGDGIKLPFNDESFSFGHPYYDSKSKTLYFASDIKGGKGGKDIYTVKAEGSVWGNVQNLSEINTAKDELFPFMREGIIFFSSNTSESMGGLDVFWKILGQQEKAKPLNGLNTEFDDFGIYIFPDMAKGYFSSNRDAKSSDDIFFFYLERKVIIKNELAGKFLYRNLEGNASGLKVKIIDDEGFELMSETDENGNFIFKNLDKGGNYTIQPLTEEEMALVIFDKAGNIMATLMTDEKGAFTYKLLDPQGVGTLSLLPEDMSNFELDQGHLSGQFVFENDPGKYPNGMPVVLTDEEGNVKFTTNTDERGNFDFKQLSLTQNYLLQTIDADQDLVLLIYDKKGNVTAQLKSNKSGQFVYRKLDANFASSLAAIESNEDDFELETKTISGYFEYKNLTTNFGEGLKVYAYSEDGFLLAETSTDQKGEFRFRSLPVGDNILFKIDESDEQYKLDEFTLYVYDRFGKKIAVLKRGQNGYFIYKPLGFETNSSLQTIETDNPEFTFNIKTKYDIITVYFDSNQSQVKSSDTKKLNELVKVLKDNPKLNVDVNAYADARASDEYNLVLSQKRGQWVVDYLVKKGISSSRFIVNAYGETQLVDQENHDLNRRAEIRIY